MTWKQAETLQIESMITPTVIAGAVGVVGTALTLLVGRRKARAEVESVSVDTAAKTVEMVRVQLTALIDGQKARIDELSVEVAALRGEAQRLRLERDKADERRLAAQRRVDEIWSHLQRVEAALAVAGIPLPERPNWLNEAT